MDTGFPACSVFGNRLTLKKAKMKVYAVFMKPRRHATSCKTGAAVLDLGMRFVVPRRPVPLIAPRDCV